MRTLQLHSPESGAAPLRRRWTLGFISLAIGIVFMASRSEAAEINVPVSIHEALRQGVSGIERVSEPVTMGVPFPKGMLREKGGVPELAVKGAPAYQFRTLAKWDDGSVKWALADFQASVKANGWNRDMAVVPGPGRSAGVLAVDRGGLIAVDTGAVTIHVRKKGFNLFDRVFDAKGDIVESGSSRGIVVTGDDGTEYLASLDPSARVTIEENGPVRAVVKAEGSHVSAAGRMMDYTARMHFYKGSSRVKVVYTLRNASKKQLKQVHIRSLDLVTRVAVKEPEVIAAAHDGEVKGRLKTESGSLVYYQAVSDFPQGYGGDAFYDLAPIPPDYKREKSRGFTQEGYWIRRGGEEAASGTRKEFPELSYIDVNGPEGRGAAVGVRFAAGWWPKALRAYPDGNVAVGLWPEENGQGYWIRFGSHNTFEVMYDFHSKRSQAGDSMKRFQYPLVGKAPAEWYNEIAERLYPLYNFVSFRDERRFIEGKGWTYGKKALNRGTNMKVFRYFYWGWGGFENQHDFARISLVNFLRDTENANRAGEYFLYSEARFNYNADWAIYHSDDYACTDCTRRGYGPQENKAKTIQNGVTFDYEHPHWYGLPLYYYLTGDERIRESVEDFGDILKEWQAKNWIFVDPRHFGWEIYGLSAMYDFTGDKTYLKMAEGLFTRFLGKRLNPGNPSETIFMDWDRGYIAGGSGSGWKEQAALKPGLMAGYAIYDGLANYYFKMDEADPLRERVADVMEGVSEFMMREPYFEGEVRGEEIIWLPYIYNLEERAKSMHEYKTLRQAFYVNLVPYELNGGQRWLERMDKLIKTAAVSSPDHLDFPGLQSIIRTRIRPREDVSGPEPVASLSARARGSEVELSWRAPEGGAERYQIKYSRKRLVESLEFDPDARSYKYMPEGYANWWAGENIASEPVPAKAGGEQKTVIKGLKPGRYYFAIRSWDRSNNRSPISNIAEVVIE